MFRKLLLSAMALFLVVSPIFATELYESVWTRVLERHVEEGKKNKITANLVDYKGLERSNTFQSLVRLLGEVDPKFFVTRDEAVAFWVNAYNIATIKLVIENHITTSLSDYVFPDQSIWNLKVLVIRDTPYSLNDLRKKVLFYRDYRAHFAMCSAELSAPDLRREAYTALKLEAQLNDQMKRLVQNPGKGVYIDSVSQKLFVNPIFKTYAKDIKNQQNLQSILDPLLAKSVLFYRLDDLRFDDSVNSQ